MTTLLLVGDDSLNVFVTGSFLVIRADCGPGAIGLSGFEECDVVVGGTIEKPL